VRLAIPISVVALSLIGGPLRADGPFLKVTMDAGVGYIVPEKYAADHQAELLKSIPGDVKIDGFWTPTEQHVTVAERIFRETLHQTAKDATVLLPDLAQATGPDDLATLAREQKEAEAIGRNYGAYTRQYVGLVIDGVRIVFCNYSDAKKVDPATEFMYLEKYFVSGDKTHFLQCRVDPRLKTWSNVSIIGSWLPPEKNHP